METLAVTIRVGVPNDLLWIVFADPLCQSVPDRAKRVEGALSHGECLVAVDGENIVGYVILDTSFLAKRSFLYSWSQWNVGEVELARLFWWRLRPAAIGKSSLQAPMSSILPRSAYLKSETLCRVGASKTWTTWMTSSFSASGYAVWPNPSVNTDAPAHVQLGEHLWRRAGYLDLLGRYGEVVVVG